MERPRQRATETKGFIVTEAPPRRWPLVLAALVMLLACAFVLVRTLTLDQPAPTESAPPAATQPHAHT